MKYLTIDIGGTEIKAALYNEVGLKLTKTFRITTPCGDIITETIINMIKENDEIGNFEGIAISSAGVIDSTSGKVIFAGPTIPNYTGVELKQTFEKIFGVKCVVENDVNAALLGEYWKGAAKHSSSSFMITVGTGVGGAFMIDDKLQTGYNFSAGEIGYLNVNGNHYQDIASTTALVREMKHKLNTTEPLNGREIFEMIYENDIIAIETLDNLIYNLCLGISDILYLFNPQVLVLGGGIMEESGIIEPLIHKHLKKILISDRFMSSEIAFAKCGNDAGMLGALYRLINE